MIPGLNSILMQTGLNPSGGLSAVATPYFIQGNNGQTTVGAVTATPIGGVGPYTYSWAQTSGATTSISSAATASTSFDCISLTEGDNITATYKCLVTDSGGRTGYTNQVSVNFFLVG